jgi:Heparan-alpha-glucosaminide N-acetyltransferase, catalytic
MGVDVARAVALLGMMAVHLLPARNGGGGISTTYLVASGRAAAAFAVLAGVGLALATRRIGADSTRRGEVTAAVIVRGLAIGAVGLALGYPDSGLAVILPYYALLFVLTAPLLRLTSGALVWLALAAATVVPAASHLLRMYLPVSGGDNPTFGTLVHQPGTLLVELTLTGYYPVLAWMTYLCVGVAIGRLPLRSPRVACGLLAGGSALAVLAAACSWAILGPLGGADRIAAATAAPAGSAELDQLLSESQFGTTPTTTPWWLAVDAPHSSTPFDLLHTTGTALALLGFALMVTQVARSAWLALAAAGSMTLTLYTAHVLLTSTSWPALEPHLLFAVHGLAALGLALAWRATGWRGPLEAIVAALSRRARELVPR